MITQEKSSAALPLHRTMKCLLQVVAKRLLSWHLSAIENDEGIIKESSSQIYSWRLKVDTKIKKWLKAGMNIYGHYRETSTPRVNEYDGLIQQAMYFPSTIEPQDEDGNYNNSIF